MEKNVKVSILCQMYGKMLTDKQYEFLDDYYNNDLSLSEIAENNKITRQAVRDIIKQAKNGNIDASMLEKVCKKNMRMNVLNWGTGFAVSAFFLSTVIPKVQYWITRVTTGSDAFPGTAEYDNKTNKK